MEVSFEEIIDNINGLDYLGGPTEFSFVVINNTGLIKGKAIINKRGALVVYVDGKQVWYTNPDLMKLVDTVRRISVHFNCTDDSKYYIYAPF